MRKQDLTPAICFRFLRIKWLNRLQYQLGLRVLLKRDEHHRLQNDSIAAPKKLQIWGRVFLGAGLVYPKLQYFHRYED